MKSLIRVIIVICVTAGTVKATDAVFVKASVYKEDQLSFLKQVRLSNNLNTYRLDFSQSKATVKSSPRFEIRLREPTVYFSFSRPLNDFLLITVNGMKHVDIEPEEKDFKLWKEEDRAGVSFIMNFDGAKIILSYWMRDNSPVLWGSITPCENSIEAVNSVDLTYRFTPSKLVPKKLSGVYQRKIITPAETYNMNQSNKLNYWQALTPADKYLICLDDKYEAGDETSGQSSIGPCFITLDFNAIETAKIDIRNYYLGELNVKLKVKFKKYNFGLWESSKKYTNKDFLTHLEENLAGFQLDIVKQD